MKMYEKYLNNQKWKSENSTSIMMISKTTQRNVILIMNSGCEDYPIVAENVVEYERQRMNNEQG